MRILLSGATGLGDFIFKTPFIYGLNSCTPELEIDILIGSDWGVDSILRGELDLKINYIKLPSNKKFLSLCKFFKSIRTNYDYVILPNDASDRNLRWSALIFLRSKFFLIHFLPKYTTVKGTIEAIMLNVVAGKSVELVPIIKGRHEIDANLDFSKYILKSPVEFSRRPKIKPLTTGKIPHSLGSRYIVIQPNAANGSMNAKVWSPQSFDELIIKINNYFPKLGIVLVGDRGDLEKLKNNKFLQYDFVHNLLGKTSISELYEVLKGADLVLAHDSAIAHIADATDTPLVALYGPTDITKTRVFGEKSIILKSLNDTFALMYKSKMTELDISNSYPPYYCMSGISVSMVYEQVYSILTLKESSKFRDEKTL